MRLLAGLGNPGAQYAGHRHNIGFMALDAIQRRHDFSPWSKKFRGEIAEGSLGGKKVLLIKPQTFMNLSGESVGEAMRFYKLSPADLTVIYDELDLAPGRARIKTGGGHGGHNGIKSLDAHCGTEYRRLRLGIGHPGAKERVNGHVLGDFAKSDRGWLEPLLDAVADHADLLIRGEDSQFLNKLALAVGAPAEADARPAKEKPARDGSTKEASPKKPQGQSHIRQARGQGPKAVPETGPMAEMLKKMFGPRES